MQLLKSEKAFIRILVSSFRQSLNRQKTADIRKGIIIKMKKTNRFTIGILTVTLLIGIFLIGINIYNIITVGYVCIFRRITGYPCPGCGMSRACLAALQFKFDEAFEYHPLFFLVPIMLFIGIVSIYDKNTKRKNVYFIAFLTFISALVICWAIRLYFGWRG